MLEEVDRRIFDDRGELAVIVQHAYHLAALRAQPVIRGALARLKIPDRRKDTLSQVGVLRNIWACVVNLFRTLEAGTN